MTSARRLVTTAILLAALPVHVALAGSATNAAPPELWVLDAGSRTISIVSTASETVTGSIALPGGAGAPEPSDLCAASLPGHAGEYAFALQGNLLHVFDTAKRQLVRTVDVGALLARATHLAACAAAPPEQFDAVGSTAPRSHLFASADVAIAGTPYTEPHFIVFDQSFLVDPENAAPIVGDGALLPSDVPVSERGIAYGVAALGTRWGDLERQRAWFTVRTTGAAPLLRDELVARASAVGAAWTRITERTRPLTVAAPPERSRVGAPHDRDLPVAANPSNGTLINLDHGGTCAIGGSPSVVLISGPAPGALRTYALDASAQHVVRVNEHTCTTSTFATGRRPSAMERGGHGPFGSLFIANRGDDSVSVLHADDSITTIPLGPPPSASCTLCPAALTDLTAARSRGCTIASLAVNRTDVDHDGSSDDVLTWTPIGCDAVQYAVYCQCTGNGTGNASCPCYCDPAVDPTCLTSLPPPQFAAGQKSNQTGLQFLPATPWKPMGLVGTPTFTLFSAGAWSLSYTVVPETP